MRRWAPGSWVGAGPPKPRPVPVPPRGIGLRRPPRAERSAPPQARPVPGSLSASPRQADGHVPTRVPLNHRGYVAPLAHGAGRICLSSRRRAEAAPAPGRGPGRPALRHCGRPASAEGTAPASGCSGPGCAPGSRARGQDLGSSDPGSVTGEHVPPPAPRPALRSPTLGPRLTPDAGLRGGTGPLPLPPFLPRPLPGPRRSRAHAASPQLSSPPAALPPAVRLTFPTERSGRKHRDATRTRLCSLSETTTDSASGHEGGN